MQEKKTNKMQAKEMPAWTSGILLPRVWGKGDLPAWASKNDLLPVWWKWNM